MATTATTTKERIEKKKSVKERKKTSGTRCVKLDIYGEEGKERKK